MDTMTNNQDYKMLNLVLKRDCRRNFNKLVRI